MGGGKTYARNLTWNGEILKQGCFFVEGIVDIMPGVSRSDPDVEGGEGINPQRKVLRQGAASFAWAEKISLSFPGAWGSFCEHCTINV